MPEPVVDFVEVKGILTSDCGPCHLPKGKEAKKWNVEDFNSIKRQVNLKKSHSSSLLAKGAGSFHGGGAIWEKTDDNYSNVKFWIKQRCKTLIQGILKETIGNSMLKLTPNSTIFAALLFGCSHTYSDSINNYSYDAKSGICRNKRGESGYNKMQNIDEYMKGMKSEIL